MYTVIGPQEDQGLGMFKNVHKQTFALSSFYTVDACLNFLHFPRCTPEQDERYVSMSVGSATSQFSISTTMFSYSILYTNSIDMFWLNRTYFCCTIDYPFHFVNIKASITATHAILNTFIIFEKLKN